MHVGNGTPVTFGFALLFFGWRRLANAGVGEMTWDRRAAALHVFFLLSLVLTEYLFVHPQSPVGSSRFRLLATIWTALMVLVGSSLMLTFLPRKHFSRLVRALGVAWLYAVLATIVLMSLRHFAEGALSQSRLYEQVQEACFQQTAVLLRLFYPTVIVLPEHHVLGTPHYMVSVAWLCSGVEGLAMVAVLLALWLTFFRKELRIERALLIVPLALAMTWVLNLVRLAALIAIGDHGHPDVADYGFHAQAGWISLNFVALLSLALVQRVGWFRKDGADTALVGWGTASDINWTAVFLLPFALMVAASLVSQAMTGGFEAFYFLRPAAALLAIAIFWKHYRRIDWRFGWMGLVGGAAIGAMWLWLDLRSDSTDMSVLQTMFALDNMTTVRRVLWITVRVASAVLVVPVSEELAFRGFVARRVVSAEFEEADYRSMSWVSLVVSSALFGAMHGHMWAAGIVAGAVFWLVAKLRGRLGEAVAAHAMANAVLAVAAVMRHDYSLW